MQYLNELNDVQREAVTNIDGPALVIAGAGSGKTRVLTYRVAHLLKMGVAPWNILALTFTNKAAREMQARIAKMVDETTAKQLWMGTFHSMFRRILKMEADKLGFPNTFTIYDTSDTKSLLNSIIKELKLDPQAYKVNEVYGRISSAKNDLITPQAYTNSVQLMAYDRQTRKPEIAKIYSMYVQRCRKASAMDFDDLLLYTNILFRDHPDVLHKYQNKFKYILVDEYQDTNYSQYLIVKALAANHHNVCVVGDDAQSIYSFRGARIENILNFRNDYPHYALYKLEQNYRSTKAIVNAANSVIARNNKQIQKVSFSENLDGEKLKLIKAYTDQEEAHMVASAILEIVHREHAPFKEFAILCRTNAQSRLFEDALRKKNIPYQVYGGLSFYQRKEVRDTIAYFRITTNPNDDEALKRAINFPARGIGKTTLERLEATANQKQQSIWVTIEQLGTDSAGLNPAAISRVVNFYNLIKKFGALAYTADAYETAKTIILETGLLKEFKTDSSFEGVARLQNIEGLLNNIQEYIDERRNEGETETLSLVDFLETVSLLSDLDTNDSNNADKTSIMTLHSAKGLEFDYVFLAGLEEELFPSHMSIGSPEELEEERRLFYVGITRAAKLATLSYAQTRYKWGNLTSCTPSRFIREIDPQWIDTTTLEPASSGTAIRNGLQTNPSQFGRMATESSPQPFTKGRRLTRITRSDSPAPSETAQIASNGTLKVGSRVYHDKFGKGTIASFEGEGQNAKAIVNFESYGQKNLLLKYAKLKILG